MPYIPLENLTIVAQRSALHSASGTRLGLRLPVSAWLAARPCELAVTVVRSAVAFARWDPLRDLLAIQQRLDRFAPGPPAGRRRSTCTRPPIATCSRRNCRAEPGRRAAPDHEGRLTLSGVRRERESPCEQFHRIERGHGSFSRTFQLPLPVDADRITADLRDGVLTVTCPKATDAAARRIHIS